MSSLDNVLFTYYIKDSLSGIICFHVDDILWAGTETFAVNVIGPLTKQFLIGSESTSPFKYIGVNLSQENDAILLNQKDYIMSLETLKVDLKSKTRNSDSSDNEKDKFRALVGQLNWVSTQTRPDISFDVCELSSILEKAKIDDLLRANKVVKYLRSKVVKLQYPKLNNTSQVSIECYCDASFGNLERGGSQGGYIIFIADEYGNKCPVTWQSRRLRRVVKSTLAAETLALLDAAEAGVYIANLFAEIMNTPVSSLLVKCYVDNKSLVEALYSTKAIEDKQLRINMAVLRDMLAKADVYSVSWIQSSRQLANVLTKRGACPSSLLASIGIVSYSC